MVIQLATLVLVSVYKQGMAIDTPTRRYKTGRYVKSDLYIPRDIPQREQVNKLTIQTCMKN